MFHGCTVHSIICFDSAREPDRMSDVCDLLSRVEAGGRGVDRELHGTYYVVAHFH